MNLARYAIRRKAVTLIFILLISFGGMLSYKNLGRLEDPEFTIKVAVITTLYPGATAAEVEAEVTEPLESAIQQLKQLHEVRSESRAGISIIQAEMEDLYDKETLPQVWDELRRKVSATTLPIDAGEPMVNDDFGDVYGIFFAITGEGYSHHDLKEIAKDLRKELLLCEDVGRIDFWGNQPEVVYIEMDRTKMARLGLSPANIFNTLNQQDRITEAGQIKVGPENQQIRVSGLFQSVVDLGDLLISSGQDGRTIRLKDVATVSRGLLDPPIDALLYDGQEAVGLGISTVSGGNVVNMGASVKERLAELEHSLPLGVEINTISFQADTVEKAINGFILNLIQALAIVIVLLVIFMGLREGFIIGAILLLTILATFIGLEMMDVNLQRISLGALIIALGMLVDNAIVVAEGIVVKIHNGKRREEAAMETVKETLWPLLGATIIAILAFAAISVSKDVTGEFLGSLFKVIALSLGLSWILAITVTPYLCVKFLPENEEAKSSLYDTFFYRSFRKILDFCIHHRLPTIAAVTGVFALAVYGFGFVKQNFFPDSSRPQFTVDIRYPEGTHIHHTHAGIIEISEKISRLEGVTHLTSFTGRGGMRFILTYDPQMPSSAYGQILVDVEDYKQLETLLPEVSSMLDSEYPEIISQVQSFRLGPGGGKIEARLSGPDNLVLRGISEQVQDIIWKHENTTTIRSNWGRRVKAINVDMAEARSRELGVTRSDIANSLNMTFSGAIGGLYREGDELLPIILRVPEDQRKSASNLENTQVFNSRTGTFIPVDQVSNGFNVIWEDPVIYRLNRKRTITVSCEPIAGMTNTLFNELRPQIEALHLPEGYELEWGGEYESSTEANQKLMAKVPLAFALMFLISIMLFNTFRHPVIIFLGLPLALIGVSAGLLVTGQPFGFMATLGFLSLSGMLIKNEIVLLDQINLELASGKRRIDAVLDSAVSRVRPVSMAAFTTVLGMIPLLWDPFFAAMAVTIMAGLTFATILTLIVTPVLYATFFRVPMD